MAYSNEFDDDISILSMSQFEQHDLKIENRKVEKESCPGSVYALQLALKEMKERYSRVEDKNRKYQQANNRLISEMNDMKQTKNSWIKELIEKDVTCNQLRQKVSFMSQDVAHLHEQVRKLNGEKECLEQSLSEVKKESDFKQASIDCLKFMKNDNILANDNWENDPKNCSQDLSSKLLMKMKQEMVDIDDYSRAFPYSVVSSEKEGDQGEYHSHRKRPDAPCACLLAPCAMAVDDDASLDTMISSCYDMKDELVSHTESLRSTITALKKVFKNKTQQLQSATSDNNLASSEEVEQNFTSNVATYNSEINHLDDSLHQSGDVNTFVINDPSSQSHQMNNNEADFSPDRICPICEAVYPTVIPFTDYENHVLKHFDSEGDEITQNFEII